MLICTVDFIAQITDSHNSIFRRATYPNLLTSIALYTELQLLRDSLKVNRYFSAVPIENPYTIYGKLKFPSKGADHTRGGFIGWTPLTQWGIAPLIPADQADDRSISVYCAKTDL